MQPLNKRMLKVALIYFALGFIALLPPYDSFNYYVGGPMCFVAGCLAYYRAWSFKGRLDHEASMTAPQQIESVMDAAGVQEVRDRDWDWLDYDPAIRAETNRQLDREAKLAGDGIIYESSHGEFCKCWECRI